MMALKDGTQEDYFGAAARHFQDARSLRAAGKIDNAGHLMGFAAECAIKHQVSKFTNDHLSLHLPELIAPAKKRLGDRAGYVKMHSILRGQIFTGWFIDYRYAPTGSVTSQRLLEWEETTKRLLSAAGIKMRQP